MSALGDGSAFSRPTGYYLTVPLSFWAAQWITVLSGSATAMLLVLLDVQRGRSSPADAQWVTGDDRLRYGLSDDTWTRATAELWALGLLTVRRIPQGEGFDWRRLRNLYWIDKERLALEPFATR